MLLNKKSISYQQSAISGQSEKTSNFFKRLFTNKKGVSLVEVMIALVILLLVFLALMQTALVSIDANMTNVLRDEAVNIAEMRMDEARNTAFDSLTIGGPTAQPQVLRNIRNIANFQYNVTRTIAGAGADNRQVTIAVTWNWKENPYTHSITSIVRRQ